MPAIIYDTIGHHYNASRRQDPRIARALRTVIGSAESVLNVGAGTGSYEPQDSFVVALEPSAVMVAQRSRASAPAVRAIAEAIPFADGAFDAVLGVLTLHHWSDQHSGIRECQRVARNRVAFLTWDPDSSSFWLEHYFPDLLSHDRQVFPSMRALGLWMQTSDIRPLPIPFDCTDGFLGAFWRRPDAYLHNHIRNGMSSFARVTDVDRGVRMLRDDLESGRWHSRFGHLLELEELDVGYRIVAGPGR